MEFLKYIPSEFIKFFLVLIFSLLIGLEQRRHHISENEDMLFGTDRTFTFIGLLAYVLFIPILSIIFPSFQALFWSEYSLGSSTSIGLLISENMD